MNESALSSISLFDSNSHPTISGRNLRGEQGYSFETTGELLHEAGIRKACAVGLPGVGDYSPAAFAKEAAKDDLWIPIAALDCNYAELTKERCLKLKEMGFKGLKVHPRLLRQSLDTPALTHLLITSEAADLPLFLCSYPDFQNSGGASLGLVHVVSEATLSAPNSKLVLVHAGCLDFLYYIELCRHRPNILLDLSFTLCKYQGSSVDQDIQYAFKSFDQRICIGSDYPEFSPWLMRERFEQFTRGVQTEKCENIAWKNLASFLGVSF